MTIELESFYSRRLGSFWWASEGEREEGEVGGGGILPFRTRISPTTSPPEVSQVSYLKVCPAVIL